MRKSRSVRLQSKRAMRIDDGTVSHLMALSQAGDSAAHEAVLRACSAWLSRYFSGKIPHDQVDDLVQETLISVHRKSETYDPKCPFVPWLAAIARYRWIDRLRKTYRTEISGLDFEPESIDPENEIAASISIKRMLQLIPPKQADAITLVKLRGYSIAEAAQMTSQSESAVKMSISRGIRRLSALVEEE